MMTHSRSAAIVAEARACVGTKFRPQGRLIGVGLDCLGVVVRAADAAGIRLPDRYDYTLRGDVSVLDAALSDAGLTPIARAMPGDVLLFEPSPGMRHLGIRTEAGMVHAHAGLGRVVEGPTEPEWRLRSVWRLPERVFEHAAGRSVGSFPPLLGAQPPGAGAKFLDGPQQPHARTVSEE